MPFYDINPNKLEHPNSVATPQYIKDKLTEHFGNMFDPCPLNDNPEIDGLSIQWKDMNFINPPYSVKSGSRKHLSSIKKVAHVYS